VKIHNLLDKHDVVVVDFGGLELLTPSFADECFGRLILEHGRDFFRSRIRLKEASEATKHLVSAVLANRLTPVQSAKTQV